MSHHAQPQSRFPATRLRRLRSSASMRELVCETRLHPSDLIWPVFVQEGEGMRTAVASLSGVERYSIDILVEEARAAHALGIRAIALFPVVEAEGKSALAEQSYDANNLICRAVRALKTALPDLLLIGDVALDPYTTHGQDGIVEHGDVANDKTVAVLCRQALCLAEAGCDIVAPSDMMDGRIGAIREALEQNGHHNTIILSYAAKYASAFYGPFRDAVGSAGNLGKADKSTYQMDIRNAGEALREVELDIAEGADIVMVKPALAYLDVIKDITTQHNIPTFAYQVSGEYAMITLASEAGIADEMALMMEKLIAIKRAGAQAILTYGARDVAKYLQNNG